MAEFLSNFDAYADFDPGGDFEAFLKGVPARWVVYLLTDAQDRPVQLLCVRNLRASLKRRLGGEETIGVSKRVNYREIVRRVRWTRVDSAFEADWLYLELARGLFPETYKVLIAFRPAWFVHVNPAAEFPRYVRTNDVTGRNGVYIGPVEDKHAAARLVETITDCFDLCRYYNILTQAPHGKACAYKEMGRCPAPCDGSISMEEYRKTVELSVRTAVDPAEAIREHTRQMQQAAGSLEFEAAGKLKMRIARLAQFGEGAFRHARRLEDFAFLSLQRGPREGLGKVFLITPGEIELVACFIDEPGQSSELLRLVLGKAEERRGEAIMPAGVERVGLVAHHLFMPKQAQGVFLRLAQVDERSLARAWRELRKQKAVEETQAEGVVRELGAEAPLGGEAG